ncbi:Cell division control protein 7 [Smittium mucronatum]|uniref:Casein kinase II subunit alpha n=1 Tax=Smittium mucronatum TaxID=133383 RepID=A0A1R0H5A5_9FUNG|nr:Cell division control protein 7 [Smittium mucronatum]
MPYIKNEDFRSYYLNLPLDGIKYYFLSLFEALAFSHSKKIIHRDVKPSNFLYSVKKKHGVLVDFGLAEVPLIKTPLSLKSVTFTYKKSLTNLLFFFFLKLKKRESEQEAIQFERNNNSGMNPGIAARIYRRFDENGNPGVPRKDTR